MTNLSTTPDPSTTSSKACCSLPVLSAPLETVAAAETQSRGWLTTYHPLLIVVGYCLGGSLIAVAASGQWEWMFAMRMFMGLFFVAFSFLKMIDIAGFAKAFASYDIVAARSRAYGMAYPFIELALGVAYLLAWLPVVTNTVTLIVMVVGTIGVTIAVRRGGKIQCGCMGTMFDLPMSTVTIVEDVTMAAMAAGMLAMLLL